jgi:hypothetical protein
MFNKPSQSSLKFGKLNSQIRSNGFERGGSSWARVEPLAAAALFLALPGALSAQNPSTTVSVYTTQDQHPISSNIYGAAFFNSSANVKQFNLPTNRIGGNNTSTYNWNIQSDAPSGVTLPAGDAMNLDNDWYFESYLESTTPGGSYDAIISASRGANIGTQTIVTIPMLPYIATVSPNATTSAASLWSFSVKKYGAQVADPCGYGAQGREAADPYQTDAGLGIKSATDNNGNCTYNYVQNNPADAYVPNSPAIQKAYVQYLVNKYGDSAHGGIKYYMLDNEPSIWSGTHRDVHPIPESYDEIWNDIQQYAGAIKSVDPNATVIGPEEWDWWAMWESGKDQANGTGSGSDYATHNNTYYYPWLLQQLAAYKQANGINLIDVLSVHCYTDNGSVSPAVNTRELWDPTYHDPNWWQDIGLNGGIPDWIPLMQKWVQQYNPGLKTGCTEYSDWDSDNTISGIATQADMLGIFGYYGLDFANTFTGPYNNSTLTPSFLAFEIYRNYDGNLSTFGDTSVSTTVADPDNLSAFSALRSSDGALTLMIVNKQTGNTPVTINLPDFANTGTAQVYQVNSANQTSVAPLSAATVTNNAITATLPGPSVTLFVVPAGAVTTALATPTGLTATVGNNTVTLTWNPSVGASSYTVSRGSSSAGPFSAIGTVTVPAADSVTDTNVVNGTTYYYVVSATNSIGTSPNSAPVAATPIAPPTFTSSASASPNPVTQNSSTTITATVQCTANTLTNGTVQIIAVDPNRNSTVVESFTGQNFATNQSQPYTATLTPTLAGTYTLEVAVQSASGQQWSLNSSAGTLTVKSALSFTSTATAPTNLAVGATGTITATITNTGSVPYTNGNVVIQIFPPGGGNYVAGSNPTGVNLAAGASQTFTMTWTPPSTSVNGAYSVDVGVFDSTWNTDYYWNTDATINLTGGSGPPAFTSSATASPTSIPLSGSSTISFSVKDTGGALSNANVEIQVFNSSGTAVGTGVFSAQNFTANGTLSYNYTWTPSAQTSAVTATGNYTVEIGVFDSGWTTDYYWNSNAATIALTSGTSQAATPTFNPPAGTYTSAQSVTISDSTANSTIYYTTNGTTPTPSSTKYTGPVSVPSTETLEAIAVASGFSQSAVGVAAYTINLPAAATPTFSPAAGTYTSAQTVTISDVTAGATIYYTTDNSMPSTSSTQYTGPVSVSSTETLEAIAVASGYSQSAVGTAVYSINPPAATPAFNPQAGTYTSAQSVTISDSTANSTIYYTTNGATPTTSSTKYTGPVSVPSTETLEAIAVASGYSQSAVGTATYTINLPSPTTPVVTVSPASSAITTAQDLMVTISVSGGSPTPTGNIVISSGSYSSLATALSVGSAKIDIPAGSLALGSDVLTAAYAADANSSAVYNNASGTATVTVTSPVNPNFAISGTAVSIKPGANSGNTSTITVTPAGGFAGSVALTANITAEPAGAVAPPTLSFGSTSPVSITGTTAGAAMLTISTTAPSSSASLIPNRRARWPGGTGAVLACLLLFAMPISRRRWRGLLCAILLLGALASGVSGCGGHLTLGGGNNNSGTTPGTYVVTVTGTSGSMTNTTTVSVTVQ